MIFETKYIIDRGMTATSKKKIQIKKTCDNCYLPKPLTQYKNLLVCADCITDTQVLEDR